MNSPEWVIVVLRCFIYFLVGYSLGRLSVWAENKAKEVKSKDDNRQIDG